MRPTTRRWPAAALMLPIQLIFWESKLAPLMP